MSPTLDGMPRVLCAGLVLALALVVGSSALAARGDPKKAIAPADQARAKAMLLGPTDMAGFAARPAGADTPTSYCQALDESDLTLTGDADSPIFSAATSFVQSSAQVYASRGQADASWRRGTGAAGERCARDILRAEVARDGARLVSYRRAPFPRLAERSVLYRAVVVDQGIRFVIDGVFVQQGRSHGAVVFGSAPIPFDRAVQTRLARIVAARMAKAMRNA